MKATIAGTTMPVLELTLDPGERVIAEGGDVSWLTPGFDIQTSTAFGSGGKGGFMSGLKRSSATRSSSRRCTARATSGCSR
ncbi:AIM24 family protein [Microbacterium sp. ABRD28]|uniref:AIM24 family protein n=1 Tax=Microbacterium sp. ABRD28 TaxID=2268461 RepID=UPI00197B5861|nr:AIM24 family protein [Microbacterium sp. ABRD28]